MLGWVAATGIFNEARPLFNNFFWHFRGQLDGFMMIIKAGFYVAYWKKGTTLQVILYTVWLIIASYCARIYRQIVYFRLLAAILDFLC
jgi:protoheme IX farnesyltransferase